MVMTPTIPQGMDGALVVGGPRPLRGLLFIRTTNRNVRMPNTDLSESNEPVGSVISRGSRDEPTPAVFAYVWGPAPEGDVATGKGRASRAA